MFFLLQIACCQQQDRVAIYHVAVRIGEERAIRVAIEGNADGRAGCLGLRGYDIGMQSAALVVDVAPVGLNMG